MGKVVGAILLIVGLIIASVGGYFFCITQDLLKTGVRTTAKVVELRKSKAYTPVVQFEVDHRVVTAPSKIGSNPPTHQVGDSVTVIYRTTAPEDFWLDEPLELWFLPCLFGGIGSIFIIVGGALVIFGRG